MPHFTHGDVELAYLDHGEGEPIVLVHGFASNKEVNWVYPGWVSTLTRAGRRVIALDNRGHGASSKLYDPAAYHSDNMAEDVRALLDHLDLRRADVMGYSLGATHHDHAGGRLIRSACALRSSAASAFISWTGRACRRKRLQRRSRRRARADVTDPTGDIRFAPSPSRRARTCVRSPPASAARARRSRVTSWAV